MRVNINLDKVSKDTLESLSGSMKKSKSDLIRIALMDFYLKEERAKKNLLFFVDLYRGGIITKDILFTLFSRRDAEAIIIGEKFGGEAFEVAKNLNN